MSVHLSTPLLRPAFVMQIQEEVIKFRWGALPDDQREGIKSYISNLIIKLSSDEAAFRREKVFINKLNIILVQVTAAARQPLQQQTIHRGQMSVLLSHSISGDFRGSFTLFGTWANRISGTFWPDCPVSGRQPLRASRATVVLEKAHDKDEGNSFWCCFDPTVHWPREHWSEQLLSVQEHFHLVSLVWWGVAGAEAGVASQVGELHS